MMAKYTYLVGGKYTNKYGDVFYVISEVKIIDKNNKIKRFDYIIEFVDTKYRTKTRATNILEGKVKDFSKTPLVKVRDYFEQKNNINK